MRTEPARLGEGPSKSIHDSQAPGPGKPPDSEDVTFQCQDSSTSGKTARTNGEAASSFSPFAPVESFVVAKIRIGERRAVGVTGTSIRWSRDRCLPTQW